MTKVWEKRILKQAPSFEFKADEQIKRQNSDRLNQQLEFHVNGKANVINELSLSKKIKKFNEDRENLKRDL